MRMEEVISQDMPNVLYVAFIRKYFAFVSDHVVLHSLTVYYFWVFLYWVPLDNYKMKLVFFPMMG